MDPVSRDLEQARQELLDLGLRNTLLNYRQLKSRGIAITNEKAEEVFRILVLEGGSMSFLPMENGDAEIPFLYQNDHFTQKPERYKRTRLQTPYQPTSLKNRLRNTSNTARTALEERGVNILFLALGMLEWYESDSSDLPRKAPLVLIPVSLTRESIRSKFRLKYTGSELGTNLSLKIKLRTEFGVELPPIKENSECDVQKYFDRVADTVEQFPRWNVNRSSIVLGFFSFSKLRMFEDLDPESWAADQKPSKHPIIRALLHEGFTDTKPFTETYEENLDDFVDIASLNQICDADSSQTIALIEVQKGKSLVIQGPPGTGKSQTITNLVAAAIGTDKTILFVSEKMAALQVVKRRIDQLGLGDTCLELHSHKTNKKAVLKELQRTLELGRPRSNQRKQSAEELRQARDQLNRYVKALHTPIANSSISPYIAFGNLLAIQNKLENISTPPIDQLREMGIRDWTDTEYKRKRSLVSELQSLLDQMGMPENHPFWGSEKTVFLPTERQDIEQNSRAAYLRLITLRQAAVHLSDIFYAEPPADIASLEKWLATAKQALRAPNVDQVIVDQTDWEMRRDKLNHVFSVGRDIKKIHEQFDSKLIPGAWNTEVR